jgi:hypothetical protein
MQTEVGPNKSDLWGRVIVQIPLFIVFLYIVYVIVNPLGKHHFHPKNTGIYIYGLIILAFSVYNLIYLHVMPYWVIIDDKRNSLEIKYLLSKTKNIGLPDIVSYSSTTITSRSTSYFGMFLNLTNGKKILFSDLNFNNYTPIETFLNILKVENIGEEYYSFFYLL